MKNALMIAATILYVALHAPAQQPDDNDGRPGHTDLATKRVVVPITIYGNKPVVEVKIDGKGPYSLFLDTAAGGTFLDQSLADELRLPSSGTRKIGDPANPNAIDAKRNAIDEFTIGGATFRNFMSVSSDRSGIYNPGSPRGVIGIPVFHDVLLTFDFPNKQLIIERGSLPAPDGKRVLSMKQEFGGIFSLPISVNGTLMDAHLDTGSAGAISMPAELMDKLTLASKPVERGRGKTVGGEMVIYGANLAGDIALGDYKVKDPEIIFFGRLRGANLGYGFLNRFSITLDQVNLRFRFEGSGEAAATAPPPTDSGLAQYAGTYGERAVTVENGSLFLQRLSGPRGAGPKIKLAQVRTGEFALDEQTEVRVKFIRNAAGKIEAISVLTPDGRWETVSRN